MTLKTVAGWAAVAFITWFTIEQPDHAGQIVHNIGTFLASASSGFANFVSQI